MHDGFRTFALPLIPILREDQDPEQPLDLFVDLTGATMYWKQVGETPQYKKPPYHKIVDTFFEDPWLQGHAHFVDGAHLNFVITDHVRSSKKTKRNPRGKIKTKVKSKKKTEVSVTLSVPKRNYEKAPAGATARGGAQGEDQAGREPLHDQAQRDDRRPARRTRCPASSCCWSSSRPPTNASSRRARKKL